MNTAQRRKAVGWTIRIVIAWLKDERQTEKEKEVRKARARSQRRRILQKGENGKRKETKSRTTTATGTTINERSQDSWREKKQPSKAITTTKITPTAKKRIAFNTELREGHGKEIDCIV